MKSPTTYSVVLPLLDILENRWAISTVNLLERPHLQEFILIDWGDGGKLAHRIVQIHHGAISFLEFPALSSVVSHLVLHPAQKKDYPLAHLVRRGWTVFDRNILPPEA